MASWVGEGSNTTRAQGAPLYPCRKLTPVKLRGLPGALALGLLASVLGHMAGYGNEHTMGGAYHGMLLVLADVGVGSFLLAAAAVAVAGAGRATEGSILAARLADWVPDVPMLALATVGWFSITEAVEGTHPRGDTILVVLALVVAMFVVRGIVRAIITTISKLAITINCAEFAPRSYAPLRRFERPLSLQSSVHSRRLFARPPPSLMHRSQALHH